MPPRKKGGANFEALPNDVLLSLSSRLGVPSSRALLSATTHNRNVSALHKNIIDLQKTKIVSCVKNVIRAIVNHGMVFRSLNGDNVKKGCHDEFVFIYPDFNAKLYIMIENDDFTVGSMIPVWRANGKLAYNFKNYQLNQIGAFEQDVLASVLKLQDLHQCSGFKVNLKSSLTIEDNDSIYVNEDPYNWKFKQLKMSRHYNSLDELLNDKTYNSYVTSLSVVNKAIAKIAKLFEW